MLWRATRAVWPRCRPRPDAGYIRWMTLQPEDIVGAIAFAVGSPSRMNVAMLEVVPTFQVVGELRFASRSGTALDHGGSGGRQ